MLLEILNAKTSFTATEQNLADFALLHPEELQTMSANDLADAAYTSKASVFRFLNKIGMSGFPEFKNRLLREVDEVRRLSHLMEGEPFSSQTSMQEALQILPSFFESVIYQSALKLNVHYLRKAGNILYRASVIDIYGLGITESAALAAKYKFESLGKNCSFHTGLNEHYLQLIKERNHVALLLSFTGENVQILKTAKLMKQLGIPTVALSHEDSPIFRECTVSLPLFEGQNVLAMEFMDPYYSMHFIVDLLFIYMHVRNYDTNRKAAEEIKTLSTHSETV